MRERTIPRSRALFLVGALAALPAALGAAPKEALSLNRKLELFKKDLRRKSQARRALADWKPGPEIEIPFESFTDPLRPPQERSKPKPTPKPKVATQELSRTILTPTFPTGSWLFPKAPAPKPPPPPPSTGNPFPFLPLAGPVRPLTKRGKFGACRKKGGKECGRRHHGVDLHQKVDAPVFAVADGVVKLVKYNQGGYDWYVILDHLGVSKGKHPYETLYAHIDPDPRLKAQFLAQKAKSKDQRQPIAIAAGEVVGKISGKYGGPPHLHFEVLRANGGWKGNPLPPEMFFPYR